MYIFRYSGAFVYAIEKLLRIKYTFKAINYKHIYIIMEMDFELSTSLPGKIIRQIPSDSRPSFSSSVLYTYT